MMYGKPSVTTSTSPISGSRATLKPETALQLRRDLLTRCTVFRSPRADWASPGLLAFAAGVMYCLWKALS
jgi:hypothetical protein